MSKNKKLVPKRRFKEFQNSDAWEQRELGEVVQITMGQSPLGSNYTENPSDYILVQGNADMKMVKYFHEFGQHKSLRLRSLTILF